MEKKYLHCIDQLLTHQGLARKHCLHTQTYKHPRRKDIIISTMFQKRTTHKNMDFIKKKMITNESE